MKQPPTTFELKATATTEPPWGWRAMTAAEVNRLLEVRLLSARLNRLIEEARALREMEAIGVPAIVED